jgi:hypothetical protein
MWFSPQPNWRCGSKTQLTNLLPSLCSGISFVSILAAAAVTSVGKCLLQNKRSKPRTSKAKDLWQLAIFGKSTSNQIVAVCYCMPLKQNGDNATHEKFQFNLIHHG